MFLAASGISDHDDVLPLFDEIAGSQLSDGAFAHILQPCQIKFIKRLQRRESCSLDPPLLYDDRVFSLRPHSKYLKKRYNGF